MPNTKNSSKISLDNHGLWRVVLKGKRYANAYGDLDDAVDLALLEETLACARVVSTRESELRKALGEARANKREQDLETLAFVISELRKLTEAIQRRAAADFVDSDIEDEPELGQNLKLSPGSLFGDASGLSA